MTISTPIHDFLTAYQKQNFLRCHTPGHNGLIPHDITEIYGADSLFEAEGIIAQSEDIATRLFQTGRTLYSCAGSTLCIQSMLSLVKKEGKNRISAGRYSHRSLVSAAVLLGFEIDWIYPKTYLSADISPSDVEMSITRETAGVFVNALDYYGGECDIGAVGAVCNRYGVPLLVDNAHGAYRVFTEKHPIKLGATMCCDSAHKTLPALTGTAYLHLSETAVDLYGKRAKEMMRLFGSSSPSYLLLESLDLLNRHIGEDMNSANGVIKGVKALKTTLSDMGIPLYQSDELRITVLSYEMGYRGFDLDRIFRSYGVQGEMADEDHVVLLFSSITKGEDLALVETMFRNIERKPALKKTSIPMIKPHQAMSLRDAFFAQGKSVDIEKGVGGICGEFVAPCPPGVPVLMPGEVLTREAAEVLSLYGVTSLRMVHE